MSETTRWDERYAKDDTPWESGQPSSELRRIVAEAPVRPCRTLELGSHFDIIQLREFRFDPGETDSTRFLGWSCLLRRRLQAGPHTAYNLLEIRCIVKTEQRNKAMSNIWKGKSRCHSPTNTANAPLHSSK